MQAGVLILLVLAVQWLFRRQLTHRWRFALWWIVLVRLLLPLSSENAVRLFNCFQPQVNLAGPRYPQPSATVSPQNEIVGDKTGSDETRTKRNEPMGGNVSGTLEPEPFPSN